MNKKLAIILTITLNLYLVINNGIQGYLIGIIIALLVAIQYVKMGEQ